MQKVFKTIENYLIKNFGTKNPFVLDNNLGDDAEVYGIHSIVILVKRADDGSVHYKPIFKGMGNK